MCSRGLGLRGSGMKMCAFCNPCFLFLANEHDMYLKKTCQNSISRSPEQGMYDTILTLKNRRKNRRVFLPAILRRFFDVFVLVVYIVDIQYDT